MSLKHAVDLQRLVDIEARTKRSYEAALLNRNFRRANHLSRRLGILDRTINDMSLEAIHLTA